jgi:hypothetical protein
MDMGRRNGRRPSSKPAAVVSPPGCRGTICPPRTCTGIGAPSGTCRAQTQLSVTTIDRATVWTVLGVHRSNLSEETSLRCSTEATSLKQSL